MWNTSQGKTTEEVYMINSHKMVSLEYLGEVTLLALFPGGEATSRTGSTDTECKRTV